MGQLTEADWPKFSVNRSTPNDSEFRIGTQATYTDIPKKPIQVILDWIYETERQSEDPEEAYRVVSENLPALNAQIWDKYNDIVESEFLWLGVNVKKLPYADKRYNIQLVIDWDELDSYLDELATTTTVPFAKKYGYILDTRNFDLPPDFDEPSWITQEEQEKVLAISEAAIKNTEENITRLHRLGDTVTQQCLDNDRRYYFFLYSKDFKHSLDLIGELFRSGRIAAAYRETRNMVEEITEAITLDTLAVNDEVIHGNKLEFPLPTNDWFSLGSRESNLNHLGQIKSDISPIVDHLLEDEAVDVSKSAIQDHILSRLNFTIYVAATSRSEEISFESYQRDKLVERSVESVGSIIETLAGTDQLSNDHQELVRESIEEMLPESDEIYIKFPTGFFGRQFVSKYFEADLNTHYKRYSFHSHAYPDTWQVAPCSSILEFKLFSSEFEILTKKINDIFIRFGNKLEN